MKAGWETRPLGETCTFTRGLTYKKGDEDDTSSSIVLRANNIDLETNTLNFDDLKRIKANIPIPETKKVSKGSLLICTASGSKAHLGKVALIDADYDYAFGGFMGQLTPNDSLDPKFFYYALTSESYKEFISNLSDGANINNLKFSQLERFKISIPAIEEQQRIVAILDEAFAGIATATANAEKNLQNARELFESTLQSVFAEKGEGWVEKPISEICNIKHGFAFKGQDFAQDTDESKPIVITPGNFTEDGQLSFTEKNTKRLSAEPPKEFIFDEGDLVIVMTDLSSKMKILGKPAFIESGNILHNQRIGKIEFFDDSVDARLLYYFFMTQGFLRNIKESATGTMVKHTAPKRILSNVIPYPEDRDEQQQVVDRLDALAGKVRILEEIYEKKLIELMVLKQSILQKAFAGELH